MVCQKCKFRCFISWLVYGIMNLVRSCNAEVSPYCKPFFVLVSFICLTACQLLIGLYDRNLINFLIFDYNHILKYHHHHHVVQLAWISLTLTLLVSLSFVASGRSSGLHPVSSHSCCMYVRAGRPAFDWPYAGVHRSTSLTISSLLLQQCPACLVRLACIVFVTGGR